MRIDKYKINNKTVLTIIRDKSNFKKDYFLTEKNQTFQLGMLKFKKGGEVQPHYQVKKKRIIFKTSKFIYLKKGEFFLNIFKKKKKIKSFLIKKNDMILIDDVSISLEFTKPSLLIEIKQGPYNKNKDKIKFNEIKK